MFTHVRFITFQNGVAVIYMFGVLNSSRSGEAFCCILSRGEIPVLVLLRRRYRYRYM